MPVRPQGAEKDTTEKTKSTGNEGYLKSSLRIEKFALVSLLHPKVFREFIPHMVLFHHEQRVQTFQKPKILQKHKRDILICQKR